MLPMNDIPDTNHVTLEISITIEAPSDDPIFGDDFDAEWDDATITVRACRGHGPGRVVVLISPSATQSYVVHVHREADGSDTRSCDTRIDAALARLPALEAALHAVVLLSREVGPEEAAKLAEDPGLRAHAGRIEKVIAAAMEEAAAVGWSFSAAGDARKQDPDF